MSLSDGAWFRFLIVGLAALIGLQFLMAATGAVMRARDIPDLAERPIIEQAQAAVLLLEQLPPAQHDQALDAMSSPFITFDVINVYENELESQNERGEPLAVFRPIIANYRSVLGDRPFRVYSRNNGGWRIGRDADGQLMAQDFLIVIRLADGAGLLVQPSPVYQRHLVMNLSALVSSVVGLALLAALVWASLATARPLRDMAMAAERLSRDLDAPPMPERGPRTVRELAAAFNAMQRELRRLMGERTRTLAAIAHDLRTYLTRLRMRAEFIEDESQREKAMRDVTDMTAMIEDTLALARAVDAPPSEATSDLAALVEEIAAERQESGDPVTVQVIAEGPLPVRASRGDLKRALANLVDNGVRYGGRADVSLTRDADRARLVVRDDGPGVPEDDIPRLFEPYARLESSRSRDTGGTGLGLAIAKAVIDRAAGTLSLANATGGGLEARVTLPLMTCDR